jgi:hypothetical protein
MSTIQLAIENELQERQEALETLREVLTKIPDHMLSLDAPVVHVVAAKSPLITLKYYDTPHTPPGLLSALLALSQHPDQSQKARQIEDWHFFSFKCDGYRVDVDVHPRKPCKRVRVTQIIQICGDLNEDSYESVEVLEELDNDGS